MRAHLIHRPALQLLLLICICLFLCAAGTWYFMQLPRLGLLLSADNGAVLLSGWLPGQEREIPLGARLEYLADLSGNKVELLASDLVEDPDILPDYREMDSFFARQESLFRILSSPRVWVSWSTGEVSGQSEITPQGRPLGELPLLFWWQLLVGLIGIFIPAWVYLLRPSELPVRMFLVTGVGLLVSSISAAIYSSRELALSGDVFRLLSGLNHTGASLFGCAFIALFASYPKRVAGGRFLVWQSVFFATWLASDLFQWAGSADWGCRLPCLIQLLLACYFAFLQWRQSKQLPLERAALNWLVLSTMLGCGLAAVNVMLLVIAKGELIISQAYSFGFFLIMYLGIALGLGRYRLFDLDTWSYRVLIWLAGIAAIVLCDLLLIYGGLTQSLSLGLSLMIAGGLYFPFRQWLWQRLVGRGVEHIEALIPRLSGIAFLALPEEQEKDWDQMMDSIFFPLEIRKSGFFGENAHVRHEGLELYVPPCAGIAPRMLRYAGKGKKLFSTRDARFVDALGKLLAQVMAGRSDYEKGMMEERLRIGRDLHDNIGARLLKLIHYLRGDAGAEIARDAMKDLRTAIAAIDGKPVPLGDALADWHAETEARCDTAGVALQWRQDAFLFERMLSPRFKAMLESILRELVTNALKHANPDTLAIRIEAGDYGILAYLENDGRIAPPEHWRPGYGLRNIRGRLAEFGGSLEIASSTLGVKMTIRIPFELKP